MAVRSANLIGLASEYKERRLETVLGVVDIAVNAPADIPNQPGIALQQAGERILVLPGHEAVQQVGIGRISMLPRQLVDITHHRLQRPVGH
jgi:hypothetical protein